MRCAAQREATAPMHPPMQDFEQTRWYTGIQVFNEGQTMGARQRKLQLDAASSSSELSFAGEPVESEWKASGVVDERGERRLIDEAWTQGAYSMNRQLERMRRSKTGTRLHSTSTIQ